MRAIFTQKNNDGLPRVTNVKKVVDDVVPKLAEYLQNEYHVKFMSCINFIMICMIGHTLLHLCN